MEILPWLKIMQEKTPTKQTTKTAKDAKIPFPPTRQITEVPLANKMPQKEKPRTATDKKEKFRKKLLPEFFCAKKHKNFIKKGERQMQKNEAHEKRHDLALENRKVLKATGVCDVEGFDETKVYAMLEGTAFTVCGKNLKVISFSAESGDLRIEGEIDSVTYAPALPRRAGLFARLFR